MLILPLDNTNLIQVTVDKQLFHELLAEKGRPITWETISETLDELERQEDITTGVLISPNAQYYPVSIEKFISTILDDEFM